MSKIALMFPGQGSQYLNMGKDFYHQFDLSKKVFNLADDILGYSLTDIIFSDSDTQLNNTQYTQVALLTVEIAIFRAIQDQFPNFSYQAVIGHSLGEYSAYTASNRLKLEDAFQIVSKRGDLMSKVSDPDAGMTAILKISEEDINTILDDYKNNQEVVVANYNSDTQIVISGRKSLIETQVIPKVKELKGKALMLNVSGAFHSPFMEPVSSLLANELIKFSFYYSDIRLYSNFDSLPIEHGNEVEFLKKQIYSPVNFTKSIKNMINDGYTTFIEIGPKQVLKKLVEQIDSSVCCLNIETVNDLEKIKNFEQR